MKIRIHRGTHQIGGCVTEYEHEGWRLFVDYGEPLPGEDKSDLHIEARCSSPIITATTWAASPSCPIHFLFTLGK